MVRRLVLFAQLWLLAAVQVVWAGDAVPLTIGFLPYLTPSELLTRYAPLADYLGQQLGRPARVVVAKDYATHVQNLREGKIDIAFLGAAAYVKLVEENGPQRLLARFEMNGEPYLHSLILVRSDSPLRDLKELRGKRFAFGDSQSTLSHVIPRAMLLDQGIDAGDVAEFGFLGNHENVVMNILFGRYDAGAVADEVFAQYQDKPLRVLASSGPISAFLFVAGPRVPAAEAERYTALLQRLKESPEGRTALAAIGAPITGFVATRDNDFDPVRRAFARLRAVGVRP